MGLTTRKDVPDGKIKKSDVAVAKNYLKENELRQLTRLITSYSDFAKNMTIRKVPLTKQSYFLIIKKEK